MLLGLITDIHEHVEHLRTAIRLLKEARVERVLVLGDVFEDGRRLVETCALLASVSKHGVWGNHDYGLCVDVGDEVRVGADPDVLRYMSTLRPNLVIDGCFFQHVEPWLNPESLEDLWQHNGPADSPSRADRALRSVDQRVVVMGHLHRWALFGEEGIVDWNGEGVVMLRPPGRYFLAVAALCHGWAATFDTTTGLLAPIRLAEAG